MIIYPGATSQTITIQIVDDTGLAVTGLVAATFPTTYYQRAGEALPAAITLSDLAATNSTYSSGGVKELTGGYYRLDVPNAAFATATRVRIIGEASGKHIIYPPIDVNVVRADDRNGDAIPTAAQNAAAIDTATLATDIAAELQGSGVSYTVVSPIAQDGDSMTIVPGDDYADADSRAIGVTITGTQPAYTGATPRLRMSTVSYDAVTGEDTTTVVTVTGTVVTATGATRVVKFEPTAADTSQLAAGVGTWEVEVTLTSGNVLTPIVDKELIVKPQLG